MKKITVVTAAFFGKDKTTLLNPVEQPKFNNVTYELYTNSDKNVPGWNSIILDDAGSPRLKAREVKTNIHKFLPNSDYWLWIDSNCLLKVDPHDLLVYLEDCDMAVMPHPERSNIIEEANILFKWKPEQTDRLQEAVDHYYLENYVPNVLYETKVLFRRNSEKVRSFNSLWWEQIKKFSIRDQISFPFVAWKTKLFVNTFPGNNSQSDVRFKYNPYIPYWDDIIRV